MDSAINDGRGVLYPEQLPTFERVAPPRHLASLVQWFWISRWDTAPGQVSRQHLLPFPLMNMTVGPEGVSLSGPSTSAAYRDLAGCGWVVAALLKPAAAEAMATLCGLWPAQLRDREVDFAAAGLHEDMLRTHLGSSPDRLNHDCTRVLAHWFDSTAPAATELGLLANRYVEYVASTARAVRLDQVAEHMNMSVRSLQRLSMKFVGVSPLSVIRRYRLQEAAEQLRTDPQLTIAQIAASLEYADQAHLSSDFKKVLGFSPAQYRANSAADR